MDIEFELLSSGISEMVQNVIREAKFTANEIVQSVALSALAEIQEVLKNDGLSDFDAIEQIVCIFEKYNIDCGVRHDF